MTDRTLSYRLDEETHDRLERLAEQHNVSKSEVARIALQSGLRAGKYYPDDFSLGPLLGTDD
jgi:predicted transcriptional regulator